MNLRINNQPAFLLTTFPWRESSVRAEIFSRDYGRVNLLVRSARKRQSDVRGVLMPFVPLEVSWFGQDAACTLHRVRRVGGWAMPAGQRLLSAMYVNELMVKMTAPNNPQPKLFDALSAVMCALSASKLDLSALRLFEWSLLCECGVAPDITRDDCGDMVDFSAKYIIRPQMPLCKIADGEPPSVGEICGETLHALASGSLKTPQVLRETLAVNRLLLDFYLQDHQKNLNSRRLQWQIRHRQMLPEVR